MHRTANTVTDPHQDHAGSDQDQKDQHLASAATSQDEAVESGGSVPALVITQAEEQPYLAALIRPPVSPEEPAEPRSPADLVSEDLSLSSSPGPGDTTCSDLLSLRSDSLSLSSEPTVSRRSEEDDTRSVTASSFMSLFHRVQLDPLEKDWMRSSALGNTAAQRQLLAQEPGLVFKKTALHWAAKQGRQEAVDLMIHRGADVNVRSGYTALHLASIHGHQHLVRNLVNTYNAKTSIRDYHGKKAVHYWTGSTDVFHKPDSHSGGSFSHGRRTPRYALSSVFLSRSRSQGQLNLEFGTVPQSASHDTLDLQV
ncbi:ankyrin repeat domain-containing protein SOWAHC-like [Anabas testudineus]|uniref:ankyrin repeat domain-containing protein SOWAHC-like n=1 Tax=Anabas testudineus TaxID=64144 RepID=UPI000E459CF9|nr:ankyrin repeat domain-containing protein SOWAHC-like [Anabas testudineus]